MSGEYDGAGVSVKLEGCGKGAKTLLGNSMWRFDWCRSRDHPFPPVARDEKLT